MNEEGFASKIAFDARDNTARSCDCVTAMPDPRWSALEDIRKKLER